MSKNVNDKSIWHLANCIICGRLFEYPTVQHGYAKIPATCGEFKCEHQHQHPELKKSMSR